MLQIDRLPVLRAPVMVAAFAGWNDAAEAATDAVEHLHSVWNATPVARFDPEDYYDFQVHRPTVSLREDGGRDVEFPTTSISLARVPGASRDVLLVRGLEPSIRWRAFCRELLDFADNVDIELVVTVGALLADMPHTRPVQVTGTCTDPELGAGLGLQPSTYEGPTGIIGVLQHEADKRSTPGVSYWAAVPHYVGQPPCPKASLALLHRVEDLLDIPIPLGDLPERARAWERGVAELAAEDPEVAEYVESLEAEQEPTELPEASGDAIAKEFERYLRRRERGER